MPALTPDEARRFEIERRRRLVAMAAAGSRATGSAAELVLAADPFVITPVGRVADIARAHAEGDEVRTVIAGYHWFTDWGRDTMISLEGLTLATGRHREAGWILRTFAHYVRDGLIPNMFPEGEQRGPLPHRRRDAVVLPRAGPLPRACTGDRDTLQLILPMLHDIVRHHIEGTRFGIRVDPQDGLLTPGRRGLPADLDGRQGRRLGRDAAARQGGRDQRALVQRAAPAGGLARATPATREADDDRGAGRAGAAHRSTGASGTTRAAISTTWSTARTATTRRSARTRSSRSRSTIRCSTRSAGSRSSTRSRERLLTPVGLRSLAPGEPGLQAALFRRSARARRRLSPGHGVGLADRPVHRRLAQDPSRRHARRARLPRRLRAASRRSRRSARSARSSTPSRRSRRAAASRRPGASPKCCAAAPQDGAGNSGGNEPGPSPAAGRDPFDALPRLRGGKDGVIGQQFGLRANRATGCRGRRSVP